MPSVITDFGSPYVRGVSGIDGKVIGNTALLVTDPNEGAHHYILLVAFGAGTLAGVTTGPTVSVGTNSPNFDNIVPATVAPVALAGTLLILPSNTTPLARNGASVMVRISVAANAITFTFRAHLLLLTVLDSVP